MKPKEPVYDGKRLSFWLAEYDHLNQAWQPRFDTPANEAVRHMGTNGFPMILHRLRYRDPALEVKLFQFIKSHPELHLPLPALKQNEYNGQAVHAIGALGFDARSLVPALAEALDHMTLGNRLIANDWLKSLGSYGGAAVPSLIEMLKDKNDKWRFKTVEALADVGREQANVVLPVLEQCLNDPDFRVRMYATNALTRIPWAGLHRKEHTDDGKAISTEKPPMETIHSHL